MRFAWQATLILLIAASSGCLGLDDQTSQITEQAEDSSTIQVGSGATAGSTEGLFEFIIYE